MLFFFEFEIIYASLFLINRGFFYILNRTRKRHSATICIFIWQYIFIFAFLNIICAYVHSTKTFSNVLKDAAYIYICAHKRAIKQARKQELLTFCSQLQNIIYLYIKIYIYSAFR